MTSRPEPQPFLLLVTPAKAGVQGNRPVLGALAPRFRGKDDGGTARGFTLIELVVVLAIIGLTLTIAIPLLGKGTPGVSLNAATGEIRAALRTARSTAIAEDRRIVFRGDAAGGYWLDRRHYALDTAAIGGQPTRIVTAGATLISFYPSGGSSGGRILVTSGAGRREIAVDAVTGRADVR